MRPKSAYFASLGLSLIYIFLVVLYINAYVFGLVWYIIKRT